MIVNIVVIIVLAIIERSLIVESAVTFSVADVPSCLIVSRLRGNATTLEITQKQRTVVIGDIHGDQQGFLEILYVSGIIRSINECVWKLPQSSSEHIIDKSFQQTPHVDASFSYDGTLFIQTGDVVDRGPNTLGKRESNFFLITSPDLHRTTDPAPDMDLLLLITLLHLLLFTVHQLLLFTHLHLLLFTHLHLLLITLLRLLLYQVYSLVWIICKNLPQRDLRSSERWVIMI